MPSDHTVVLSLRLEFLKHGCRHIRSWSGHQQTGVDPACRTWRPYPVSIRYPLLRCCWPTHTMSDFSPRAWHCDPMARLGLWAVAGSVICIRNVMQIDILQVKNIEWKPHGRNSGWHGQKGAFYSFLNFYHTTCCHGIMQTIVMQ